MRKIIFILFLLFFIQFSKGQLLRIAILDFDNISGIAKYDGLGKAMSSMLISDIESNVSSKRMQLVERSQINKIMKEQNLQKSASFDKTTAVKMGKLLGVNFLLIGDIYVLDNILVINARLTDASSGDIKFSEKQEGRVNEWLTVKTKLGKGVATSLSMPFTEPRIPDAIVNPAVLTTYASAIDENDKGNYEKAETLINTAKEFNPGFSYFDDLRDEIEKLKKQVAEHGKKIDVLESSGGLIINPKSLQDFKFNLSHNNANIDDKKKYLISIFNNYANDLTDEDFQFFSSHGIYVKNIFTFPNSATNIKKYNYEIDFISEIASSEKYDQRIKISYVTRNLFLSINNTNFSLLLESKKSKPDSLFISEIFVTKRKINSLLRILYDKAVLVEDEYSSLFAKNISKYLEILYLQQQCAKFENELDSIKSLQSNLNPNDQGISEKYKIDAKITNSKKETLAMMGINISSSHLRNELCSCFNRASKKLTTNNLVLHRIFSCADEICHIGKISSFIELKDFIDLKKVVEEVFKDKSIVFD
jgi:TolB-like protein